ncbi:MAG TPA: FtsQ-type POTRA domain-containing protein, partial [Candidatus Limnocylindrales bacterium]
AFRLLTPVRAGGALGMLVAGLLLRLATSSPAFALDRVDGPSLQWTSTDAISAAIGVPLGTNVFGIDTGPIESRLRALPAVAGATVRVGLPSSLELQVTERQPILAWRVGETVFLVDRDGTLFADVDAAAVKTLGVPTVLDARVASPFSIVVGGTLDPLDLDVATRLASLGPADLGSAASRLTLRVDDTDGYTLRGVGQPWRAIFGIYTPSVRTPDLIPGQVQLLRSLLAGREGNLDRIVLADATNGTYTLRATPKP